MASRKDSEAELWSLLNTCNLLDYYDKFIEQGGDDVQQLCDASEEEFKEIISLVGMGSKPLHVRRLQKALVEWKIKKRGDQNKESNSQSPSWMSSWTPTPSQSPQINRNQTTTITSPITIMSSDSGQETPRKRRSSSSGGKSPPEKMVNVIELKLPQMEAIIDWEKLDPERRDLIREHSKIYGRFEKKRKNASLNSHEQMINEAAAQLCLRDPTLLVRRDELFTQARRVVRDSGFSFVHGHSRSKYLDGLDVDEEGNNNSDFTPKSNAAQANKAKRYERLCELETLLKNNREHQDQVAQKLEDAKLANNLTEVVELQQEVENLLSHQVTLQVEYKELKKKQRRSERYYQAKAARGSGQGMSNLEVSGSTDGQDDEDNLTPSGQSEKDEEEGMPEDVTSGAGDDQTSGQVEDDMDNQTDTETANAVAAAVAQAAHAVIVTQNPGAADILNPTSENSSILQLGEPVQVTDTDQQVRTLYQAFIPAQLHELQNTEAGIAQGEGSFGTVIRAPAGFPGNVPSADATINALLSLSKDKNQSIAGIIPTIGNLGLPVTIPVTMPISMPASVTAVMTATSYSQQQQQQSQQQPTTVVLQGHLPNTWTMN